MSDAHSTSMQTVSATAPRFSYVNARCPATGRMLPADESVQFWSRVQKTDGCWLWTGGTVRGYGQLKFRGKHDKASRVSWTIHFGEIPESMQVCHECDNPICVRPDHLFLGTITENQQDKVRKNRQAKGQAHGRAEIDESQARQIIEMRRAGMRACEIAIATGVKKNIVHKLLQGKTWTHLPR